MRSTIMRFAALAVAGMLALAPAFAAPSPTLAKVILPSAVAITAPMMMPRRTEILATKPLAKRAMRRMEMRTTAEMATLPKGA